MPTPSRTIGLLILIVAACVALDMVWHDPEALMSFGYGIAAGVVAGVLLAH